MRVHSGRDTGRHFHNGDDIRPAHHARWQGNVVQPCQSVQSVIRPAPVFLQREETNEKKTAHAGPVVAGSLTAAGRGQFAVKVKLLSVLSAAYVSVREAGPQ